MNSCWGDSKKKKRKVHAEYLMTLNPGPWLSTRANQFRAVLVPDNRRVLGSSWTGCQDQGFWLVPADRENAIQTSNGYL